MQRNFILKEQENISPIRNKFTKFSDLKNTTISTAQKVITQSDTNEQNISQFTMNSKTEIRLKSYKRQKYLTFENFRLRNNLIEQVRQHLKEYDNLLKKIEQSLIIRKQYIYKEKICRYNKKYLTFQKVKTLHKAFSQDQYSAILIKFIQQIRQIKSQNQLCLGILKEKILSIQDLKKYQSWINNLDRLINEKIFLIQYNKQLFLL